MQLLQELSDLYIPANERELRQVQRRGDQLDKSVRVWAQSVVEALPKGLPLNPDEVYIFCLFLAQQKRINLQMDAFQPDTSLWGQVRRQLLIPEHRPDPDLHRAVHRIAASRLDSDIERACNFFCEEHKIPPESEPAIDWRVSIRFMAQSIYARASTMDPKKITASPRRFELALVARDLAAEVVDRRHAMFSASVGKLEPTPLRRKSDAA